MATIGTFVAQASKQASKQATLINNFFKSKQIFKLNLLSAENSSPDIN